MSLVVADLLQTRCSSDRLPRRTHVALPTASLHGSFFEASIARHIERMLGRFQGDQRCGALVSIKLFLLYHCAVSAIRQHH